MKRGIHQRMFFPSLYLHVLVELQLLKAENIVSRKKIATQAVAQRLHMKPVIEDGQLGLRLV
ncbi:Hypothetical predicted protein [Podarcis lilfordi]|uniref:Uncharacterized protein n=1 Tax=Podarcis lilfordi TaxID=74358 RepID=A0AA35PK83_9SAUR|nr:Hypothetical predicted protein [Podarcis lilfordi]